MAARRCGVGSLGAVATIVPTLAAGGAAAPYAPWHFLNFFPLPHQQGSLRPTWCSSSTMRCSTTGTASCACAPSSIAPAGATTPAEAAAAASAPAPTALLPPEYDTLPARVELPAAANALTGAAPPFGPPTFTW